MKSTRPCRASQPKTATRSFCILQMPDAIESGVVRLTIDGEKQNYHFDLLPISRECGKLCVELSKGMNDESYHVLVPHCGKPACDCRGHVAHQHCKHADLVPGLLAKMGRA